ncbi:hypothetical protein AALO_G00295030 [Alosa alosa]|uniref:Fibrinogen alpha/beta/gamma chain coiled coil domain-containing protein n=1 Tax=Alosa alosa TaxID=278164 RepID=A0AAV6FG89_9TELE|nr:hypothetical protein AALO_G00295030 [Alosa alosa]
MKLQQVLCLCMLLVAAWATEFEDIGGGVRGNRPVEHGYKASDTCKTEKDWPMCTDGDWGPKCPSGCRIQGLLDKTDHNLLTRIDKIRQLLDQYRQKYRSTDQSSKQTYDYLRDRLTTSSGDDNKYMSLAESLRKRIVEVKIKIERQLRILEALKTRVREQVIEMQRLEVDIDMKLRSCKGSCAEYAKFTADRESYVAIDKQLDQLESIRVNSVESVGSLRVMKSRVLKEREHVTTYGLFIITPPLIIFIIPPLIIIIISSLIIIIIIPPLIIIITSLIIIIIIPHSSSSSSSHFSSSSSSSFPHSSSSSSSSSFPHSSSSSSSSFPHSSSSSSSHFSSSGFPDSSSSSSSPHSSSSSSPDSSASSSSHTSTSTHTMKCTRTIRKVTHHTKDGPVERVEEVLSGKGCDAIGGGDHSKTSLTQGGADAFFGGDIFKRFGSGFDDMSSPFASAGSTKTMESKTMSSTKSLLSGTKTGSASGHGDAVDDLPDIFARSKRSGV